MLPDEGDAYFLSRHQAKDWKLIDAGIWVQAIKRTNGEAGIVHYGTEVLTSADRTMPALLGASPGASVSINIVFEIIKISFPHLLAGDVAQNRIKELIPSYGEDTRLPQNAARFLGLTLRAREVRQLI